MAETAIFVLKDDFKTNVVKKLGSEVLTAATMKITVFWVVTAYSVIDIYGRFGGG
jgi:hypothetical protein